MEDYYALLSVPFTATEQQIKTAYRATALKLHLDKNPGKNTTALFQQLGRAYDELRDPHRRKFYDARWKAVYLKPGNEKLEREKREQEMREKNQENLAREKLKRERLAREQLAQE